MWDPERRTLISMMTIPDYIRALQFCLCHHMPIEELAAKTIAEMMTVPTLEFGHADFQTIDAEDSIFQLYMSLQRLGAEYVPVIDPDEGNIVSVLGYLDVLHLFDEAAVQQPQLFSQTIDHVGSFSEVMTAPINSKLVDILKVMESRNIVAMPVTDDSGQVVGLYHRSDVTFITRAVDPAAILTNMTELSVGETLSFIEQQQRAGEQLSRVYSLVKCSFRDRLSTVISSMMAARMTVAVCVNEANMCVGMVTVKDILRYFFERPSGR